MPAPFAIRIALLTGMLLVTHAVRAIDAPADIDFSRDVVYGKGGDVELKLNLARPKDSKGPLPCVIFIHGGGWAAGSKEAHDVQTIEYARKGYVSATIGYRLTGVAPWPAQINDVKCAVRFLRANAAKYGIDPDQIGAVGFSAGAHLAMMLAVTDKDAGLEGDGGFPDQSSRIQAAVSFAGPTDLARDDIPVTVHEIVRKLVGHIPQKGNKACENASPVTYVSDGDAPMLLFQGTGDALVPYNQAFVMADAMHKAHIPGRVEVLINAGHGWIGPELTRTANGTLAFLSHWLKPVPVPGKAPAK